MSEKPFVSVITSVYNAEKTLEKCIQSVLGQTYTNFEYLIIDGKSTDGTLAIVEKYKKDISFVISEKDSGIYDAWNKGLSYSKGEWVCFLGADDEFYPEAIEKMVSVALESKQQLDYISGRTNLFKNNQLVKTAGIPYDWATFRRYVSTGHNGALHHKSIYSRFGLYDTSYRSAADYELLLRLGKGLSAGYTDYITTKMNLGGASNMSHKPILEAHRAITKHSDEPNYRIVLNTLKGLLIYALKKMK